MIGSIYLNKFRDGLNGYDKDPELGQGDLPYDDERKLSIQKVEQEFNPTPVQRNQHMITPLTEMVKNWN